VSISRRSAPSEVLLGQAGQFSLCFETLDACFGGVGQTFNPAGACAVTAADTSGIALTLSLNP
jgi:hypothetical protein